MGTVISIIIGVVVVFAVLGALFSGEKPEDGAKIGAVAGGMMILNLLPFIIAVIIIIALVKSCS